MQTEEQTNTANTAASLESASGETSHQDPQVSSIKAKHERAIAVLRQAKAAKSHKSLDYFVASNLQEIKSGLEANLSQEDWAKVFEVAELKPITVRTLTMKVEKISSDLARRARAKSEARDEGGKNSN